MDKIGCELWLQMKEIAHLFTKFHTKWVLVSKKKTHFVIQYSDHLMHFSHSSGGQTEKISNRGKFVSKKIPYWAKLRACDPF